MASIQCTSANHQPSWEKPKMRAERQLIVWVRLKPQRCIVWAGDKSPCCHSDAELNPPSFLKGFICAEWAAAPQCERTCLGVTVLGTLEQEPSGEGMLCVRGGTCPGREADPHLRSRLPCGSCLSQEPVGLWQNRAKEGPREGQRVSQRQGRSGRESLGRPRLRSWPKLSGTFWGSHPSIPVPSKLGGPSSRARAG